MPVASSEARIRWPFLTPARALHNSRGRAFNSGLASARGSGIKAPTEPTLRKHRPLLQNSVYSHNEDLDNIAILNLQYPNSPNKFLKMGFTDLVSDAGLTSKLPF